MIEIACFVVGWVAGAIQMSRYYDAKYTEKKRFCIKGDVVEIVKVCDEDMRK